MTTTTEIERFVAEVNADAGLQADFAQKKGNLDALVSLANARGYKINRADVDTYIAAGKQEMSDDQLDGVAGGKKHKDKGNAFDINVWAASQKWIGGIGS